MRELLYHPFYLASIVVDNELSPADTNDLLVKVWNEEKSFLFARHQIDMKQFIKDIMEEVSYLTDNGDLESEFSSVAKEVEYFGGKISEDTEQLYYIASKLIEIRLKMLYLGGQDYVRMKFRTFLNNYGYKRRSAAINAYINQCLYFYHLEIFLKGHEPCTVDGIKLDDMITFRVIENRRSYLVT